MVPIQKDRISCVRNPTLMNQDNKDHRFNDSLRPQGENNTQGSNTIMLTSFALKFWSNKIIDVDIIQFITMGVGSQIRKIKSE